MNKTLLKLMKAAQEQRSVSLDTKSEHELDKVRKTARKVAKNLGYYVLVSKVPDEPIATVKFWR